VRAQRLLKLTQSRSTVWPHFVSSSVLGLDPLRPGQIYSFRGVTGKKKWRFPNWPGITSNGEYFGAKRDEEYILVLITPSLPGRRPSLFRFEQGEDDVKDLLDFNRPDNCDVRSVNRRSRCFQTDRKHGGRPHDSCESDRPICRSERQLRHGRWIQHQQQERDRR